MSLFSFLKKSKKKAQKREKELLSDGLTRTRKNVLGSLASIFTGKKTLNNTEVFEKLEEALISADMSLSTCEMILAAAKKKFSNRETIEEKDLVKVVKEEIFSTLGSAHLKKKKPTVQSPHIILVIGVNGAGKTTTIAKIANYFKKQEKSIVIGAADTYRAAAVEQIEMWGERLSIPVISQQHGSDPSSVAYNTIHSAISKKYDIAIIDTSGRLHNNKKLMDELAKIKRTINKCSADIPMEILLVLDATTGQNALEQAKQFGRTTDITGIVLTKIDGTAKGGVVVSIAHEMNIPVKYIGYGEKPEHFSVFDPHDFTENLFLSAEEENQFH